MVKPAKKVFDATILRQERVSAETLLAWQDNKYITATHMVYAMGPPLELIKNRESLIVWHTSDLTIFGHDEPVYSQSDQSLPCIRYFRSYLFGKNLGHAHSL